MFVRAGRICPNSKVGKVAEFLAGWQAKFQWNKTADEILDSLAKY